MLLDDYTVFFASLILVKQDSLIFCQANGLRNYTELEMLLYVNYLQKNKGKCTALSLKTLRGSGVGMESVKRLIERGFILRGKQKAGELIVKKPLFISERGIEVLINFVSFMTKKEKELSYTLKKNELNYDYNR